MLEAKSGDDPLSIEISLMTTFYKGYNWSQFKFCTMNEG